MHALKFLLALVLMSSGVSAAASAPPATADEVFALWLAAHNSGERSRMQAFNADHYPGSRIEDDMDFRDTFGRLQLADTRQQTPTTLQALLVSEWGRALLMDLAVETGPSLRVSRMRFEGAPMPEAFRARPVPMDALAADMRQRLDALAASDDLSGSVLLARDGVPVFAWHGGMADREAGVPVDASTRFRFASLGKMFTAVAILQLAETGRVSLDAPLSTYLPDYPNRAVSEAVNLRQLLNHTGGTCDVFGERFDAISGSLRMHRDYMHAFADVPLEFTPGSRDHYSNYGYILLGLVIEAVGGQSYYEHIAQHVFAPAGMTDTGYAPESEPVAGRAHGYTKRDGRWSRETASLPWRGTAAGGGYTTATDLLRFATALTDGTLLSADSLRLATQAQNNKGWYGYGFIVDGEGLRHQFGHEGGAPGANTLLNVRPAGGWVAIGLANVDPGTMGNLVNYMTQRLP